MKEVGESFEISEEKVQEFIMETNSRNGKVSEEEFLNFVKRFL